MSRLISANGYMHVDSFIIVGMFTTWIQYSANLAWWGSWCQYSVIIHGQNGDEPIVINMLGGRLRNLVKNNTNRLYVITNNHITKLHNVELLLTPKRQLFNQGSVNITTWN